MCPECRERYPRDVVACPRCREVLVEEGDVEEAPSPRPGELEVVHRVPDLAAGMLLLGMLQHEGLRATLRSTDLPGYGGVRRDWSTTAWGEILVAAQDAPAARALLADYLAALQRGGEVRDEDVESG